MDNADVARNFDRLADLLEIDGANPFRVRAYRNAARTIGDLSESLAEISADPGQNLQDIPGIGKDLAAKIDVILRTGELPQLIEMQARIPPGVLELLRLPGLGPKKAAVVFRELKIESLADLRAACEAGRVAELKGFGKTSQAAILASLETIEARGHRFLWFDARQDAETIAADLRESSSVGRVEIAGSFRRGQETVGDLDILVTATSSAEPMDRLAAHYLVEDVLARGETKQRVRLRSGIEMDLRVVPEESFGAAMQYFTGSKEHNIVVRRRAQQRGLKLNEYGLFRDEEQVGGRTEEEVYAALDLPWIPPELRENRGEIELAAENELPELIEIGDIRGDLHMHTTASDGKGTILEMAETAKARGLEYIAITDHSQRVAMAGGLDGEQLRAHWREIEAAREKISGIEILKGVECDILEDATLDLPDDVLAEADWVIAVLHYGLRQPAEQINRRLLNAIRSPYVDAIGHPTGRLLLRREEAAVDFGMLYDAAAEHGVLLEINAHPQRLDLDDVHAAAARDHGIPIVINTDAHSTAGLEMLACGILQARRAGLTKNDVANTRTVAQFRKLLRRNR